MDVFIFVGSNFHGLNKYETFVGFKICDYSVFFHNSYRKLPFRRFWNSWIVHFTKTTKIGTPRNLSHPQYLNICPFHYTTVARGRKVGPLDFVPLITQLLRGVGTSGLCLR